jgi:ABC-type nitrate/sulfonate/bicarbonate transport system substrate-binding protein
MESAGVVSSGVSCFAFAVWLLRRAIKGSIGSVPLALIVCGLGTTGCPMAEPHTQSAPLEVTLAFQGAPYSGLIAVAKEKGFFQQAGIELKTVRYPSGLDSLKAMMRGEAQIATVSDIALASMMHEDPSLRVLAAIGASSGSQIVARKDRNIHEPKDLSNKRIAYSPGTSSAYYLHSFLLTHHISPNEVTIVPVSVDRQVEVVVSGAVDAVAAFEVYAYLAGKKLGENAVAWDNQNIIDYQWLLVSRDKLTQSPEAIKRLLKALIRAEDFVTSHVDKSKAIIARQWEIDPELLSHIWNRTRLFVSYNQSIIMALQSYVKWQSDHEGSTSPPLNVLPYMFTGALEAVDPKLVTVFR